MIAEDFWKGDKTTTELLATEWPTEKPEFADDIGARRGVFVVDDLLLFDPDFRAAFMSQLVPHRVEYRYDSMTFEIHGCHETFEAVSRGMKPPHYTVVTEERSEGNLTKRVFLRVEKS